MKYKLQDLIDLDHFQNLQDRLNHIYSFPSSIIDNDGNILTATAWQDVCTKFHRKNKEAERVCIKSDQFIVTHIHEANPTLSYRCPHGLVDNATPIIIDGIHYGNFFTGQFFLEEPDLEFFRARAGNYGFDEEAYIKAVKKVPIWTKEQLDNYLFFIKGLIAVISESGLKKLKEMENRKLIETSEKRYRSILKAAIDGFWLADKNGQLLEVNDAYCRMSGYSEQELLNMSVSGLSAGETPELAAAHKKIVMEKGQDRFETKHRRKDGSLFDVEVSVRYLPDEGGKIVAFLRDVTERKQAREDLEQALHARERQTRELKLLLDGAKVVLEGNDFSSTAKRIFDAACEMTGALSGYVALLSDDGQENKVLFLESGGLPCTVDESLPMQIRGLRGEAYKTGQAVYDNDFMNSPWPEFMPDGHVELRNVMFAPLNIEGKTTGIMGLANKSGDFTEDDSRLASAFSQLAAIALKNNQTMKALTESRAILQAAMDNSQAGIAIADAPDGRLRYVNKAGLLIRGGAKEDLVNDIDIEKYVGSWRILHLDGTPYEAEEVPLARAIKYGEICTREFIIRRTKMDDRIVLANAAPIKNESGHTVAGIVVFHDITDRKQAEVNLSRNLESMKLSESLAGLGFFERNWQTGEGFWSDGFYRLMGESPDEIECRHAEFIKYVHPDDSRRVSDHIRETLATGTHMDIEFRLVQANGNTLHIHGKGRNFYDESGKPLSTIGTFLDITKRKRDEKEKEKLQAQLQQAQKMEAIGTLTGGVAHDFNNLLQAINGYTQLLLMDKAEDDPEYAGLSAIQDSVKRAADLVRSLLLFSRKANTQRTPLELNLEIESARKILERTIPKMVEIDLYPGRRLWTIMADPAQIEQILLNLGSNAADAMPDGGKLVIETENITLDEDFARQHAGAQPGRYVLLTISDNGHGMDRETRTKIFEPFFTTKETGRGTGLGLASVYGIVKNHGGYIACYSEVGQGTTFKIYLPARELPPEDEGKDITAEPPKGGDETILLVDDEEAIRGFAELALIKFGYKVYTASTGEEALEIYPNTPGKIDLVVTDIGMPGMGGHKFLQELLQIDPAAKVIIASGYSMEGNVKKSMEAGAKGYVGKPYQLVDFLNTVRVVLDEGK